MKQSNTTLDTASSSFSYLDDCIVDVAQKIIDVLQPESALLLGEPTFSANEPVSSLNLSDFFLRQGVKTSNYAGDLTAAANATYDVALCIGCAQTFTAEEANSALLALSESSDAIVLSIPVTTDAVNVVSSKSASLLAQWTEAFAKLGYVRDFSFSANASCMVSAFYTKVAVKGKQETLVLHKTLGEYEKELTRAVAENERLKVDMLQKGLAALSVEEITDDGTRSLKVALAEKDQLIAGLSQRLDESIQKMYVAKDAVVGAEAEKARAKGEATELHYQLCVRDKEIDFLKSRLESNSAAAERLEQLRETAPFKLASRIKGPLARQFQDKGGSK